LENGRVVAFACSLLRFLARHAEAPEDLPDVSWVIRHAELFGNYLGHPWAGPKVGAITGLAGSGQENFHESLLLFLVQAGLGTGMWLGLQAI
jgi:hypothetical protein